MYDNNIDERLYETGRTLRAFFEGFLGVEVPKKRRKSPKKEIMEFLSDFQEVIVRKDESALEQMIDDDFTLVDNTGNVIDKQNMIEHILSPSPGGINWNEFERNVESAKFYGNVAVLVSQFQMRGNFEEKDFSGTYRDTNSYVKRDTGWQIASSHISFVSP
ncbi:MULTISPECIES: nuclear transport factor 2 family protein [unclassified Tolypothrix]|uniref:nuclear transport factor 2 family protein n=1 Tax=unclassified Tolypothrix TaxID=2649714 RepID=UPI0005F80FCC|nr:MULTISPECIES: nuclear transport factor 2 family protein [unclassified Tolypothrix]MBE9080959.1 nuclear transport factor 2 family protein [Tolypothrix sp. LEGE 11397]UYD25408.1 nuclear transport factor 2 family protein [Tolypothrix sp. PCC 7712]UYD32347.1 nuclear transport factor 2 family protein [Tolypothrix sp. PCC 7601]BAY91354.1 hypothetical protein NIES3275_33770 [Microchaete diplosiphon NIES-3275]